MRRIGVCALLVLLGACQREDVYLMSESYVVEADGTERYAGGGCETVGGGGASGSSSGDTEHEYAITHDQDDGAVHISVRVGDTLVEERTYTTDFLRSGEVDELVVEVAPDLTLRLVYWGGPVCVPPRVPDAG